MSVAAEIAADQEKSASLEPLLEPAAWRPAHHPWAVALTVTLATFMEVLDTSIANVALPHIAGNLSASQNEATWVLTSYLVANAIVLPISAWLVTMLGRKRFYMICVALFTVSSFFCALAPSLGFLVFFRMLQGAGGGGLAPSEQAILADTFPPAQRGMAFAVYGMAVVVAPTIGPTVGGWIVDNYDWRWLFYINIPVGIVSLFLTSRLVEDPPYLKKQRAAAATQRVDYWGLALIGIAVGCLQIALDKGQEEDWFSSRAITLCFLTAALAFATWLIWEWRHPNPIVDVKMFKSRNYALAMFFSFVLGFVLYGTTVAIPQYLQTVIGYPAVKAGNALSGGGLVMLFMMPVAGYLMTRADPRKLMATGFLSLSAALAYMGSRLNLGIDFGTAALLRTTQAVGTPLIFLPSSMLAYVGLPPEKNNQASGMNSFLRNIGGSIGIALISALIVRQSQKHTSLLGEHAYAGNPAFEKMAHGLAATYAHASHGSAAQAHQSAMAQIFGMIQAHATTLAYIDVVMWLAAGVAALVPFIFLMRKPARGSAAPPAAH